MQHNELTATTDRCAPNLAVINRLNFSFKKNVSFTEEPAQWILDQVDPQKKINYEVIFDGTEENVYELLSLAEARPNVILIFRPLRRRFTCDFVAQFKKHRFYFEFMPYDPMQPDSWTVPEIRNAVAQLAEVGILAAPPPGLDVHRAKEPLANFLLPHILPEWQLQIPSAKPFWSVIIPAYNNAHLLPAVLWSLLNQTMPRSDFEVIVIDDASEDHTAKVVRDFLEPEAGALNFKFLRISQPHLDSQGQSLYRAGTARNLGYRWSSGSHLLFVDSDTVVDRDLLRRFTERLKTQDLVQSVRHYVNYDNRAPLADYADLEKRERWLEEEAYLEPFYSCKDWQSFPCPWKYVATYTLALKREDINRLGLFRSAFTSYGFEDVELGFRWWKAGAKFYLDRTPVLHLNMGASRRKGLLNKMFRHYSLAKTAKVLFANTLDLEVFNELYPYMWGESRSLRWLMGKWKKI